jgi:hypothetical protein
MKPPRNLQKQVTYKNEIECQHHSLIKIATDQIHQFFNVSKMLTRGSTSISYIDYKEPDIGNRFKRNLKCINIGSDHLG